MALSENAAYNPLASQKYIEMIFSKYFYVFVPVDKTTTVKACPVDQTRPVKGHSMLTVQEVFPNQTENLIILI